MTVQSKTSAPPTIRLAHPLAFSAFLRHIGAPVERLMRQQGLPTLCNNPDNIVPLDRAWGFFDTAAKNEDIDIGWYVGQFLGDNNFNHKLHEKLESAQTLYQALKRLIKMVGSEASDLKIGILERAQYIIFYTHYPGNRETPGYMVSQAYQLQVYSYLIRSFAGENWVPPEIGIESSVMPPIVESYFPGTRILTDQQMGYLTIPRSFLYLPSRTTSLVNEKTDEGDHGRDFDYISTLRAIMKSYLADGYLSERVAANLMGTSVRTLTRRVAESKLTYGALIDEVRFSVATEMLQDPGIKTIEIARSVGTPDQSNFTRMFRRICGLTPLQYRQLIQKN